MGPKDREERQLMRQRGAGIRQVKNTGFDLVLPGQESVSTEPLQSIKSSRSRKTPQPELIPQQSTRRTPKPDNSQLSRSIRRTPATRVTKKRGRPAKNAISDRLDDTSTARITEADEEGITTKKRKTTKDSKGEGAATVLREQEIQGDALGSTAIPQSAAHSTGDKKRKKRKSIGEQPINTKAAKARSPLKPALQRRKRPVKTKTAQATATESALAGEAENEPRVKAVPFDMSGQTRSPDIANSYPRADSVDLNAEPNAEGLQQKTAKKPTKRKQAAPKDLSQKHNKVRATQSKSVPKRRKENIPAGVTLDENQNMETAAEVEADPLNPLPDKQEPVSNVAESQDGKLKKKRKRVTVGQQPKKRVKASDERVTRKQKTQEETSTAEDIPGSTQTLEVPVRVEVSSVGHAAGEQEATTEEAAPQTQNSALKRKKRKSIGQQRHKKMHMDPAAPRITARTAVVESPVAAQDKLNKKRSTKRELQNIQRPHDNTAEGPEVESLGLLFDEERETHTSETGPDQTNPKGRRGRPKPNPTPNDAIDELDLEALTPPTEEEEESPLQPPAQPEKKKRGRPRRTDTVQPTSRPAKAPKAPTSRKSQSKPARTTRAPPKNTIPTTVYAPPSPTTSSFEDDPLTTSSTSNPRRSPAINPVDALSQLCSELLSKSSADFADQIRTSTSSTRKAELERAKHNTDLYAGELASRLLQLTTTLNGNTSLRSQVRAAAKEERELKEELKRLEREGEELRVRKEEMLKERKKRELEDMLSGIAGAVKKGWEKQKEKGGDAVAGMDKEADMEV